MATEMLNFIVTGLESLGRSLSLECFPARRSYFGPQVYFGCRNDRDANNGFAGAGLDLASSRKQSSPALAGYTRSFRRLASSC